MTLTDVGAEWLDALDSLTFTDGDLFLGDVPEEEYLAAAGALEEALQTAIDHQRDFAMKAFADSAQGSGVVAAGADEKLLPGVEAGAMFDEAGWETAVDESFTPIMLETVETAAGRASVGVGVQYISNPFVLAAAQEHVAALAAYGQAIEGHLVRSLEAALKNGLSVADTAKRIAETGAFDPKAAQAVAQTEVIAAQNGGAMAMYEALAPEGLLVQWLATPDDKTRPEHTEAGQQDPIRPDKGEKFVVGGEEASYPGSPELSISMRARCRCRVLPINIDTEASTAQRKETAMSGETNAGQPVTININGLGHSTTAEPTPTLWNGGASGTTTTFNILSDGGKEEEDIIAKDGAEAEMATVEAMLKRLKMAVVAKYPLEKYDYCYVREYDADKKEVYFYHDGIEDYDYDMLLGCGYKETGDMIELTGDVFPVVVDYQPLADAAPATFSDDDDSDAEATAKKKKKKGKGKYYADDAARELAIKDRADGEPADSKFEWSGPIVFEGVATGDGRTIAEDALVWRDLPIPLMFSKSNEGGHFGSVPAGRIARLEPRTDGSIWGFGYFDSGADGQELKRMLDEQTIRGISVDLSDVDYDYDFENDLLTFTKAEIMGATATPFPAFKNARMDLGLTASGELDRTATVGFPVEATDAGWGYTGDTDALVASGGVRSISPWALKPDPKVFECKHTPKPFRINANGELSGIITSWEAVHLSFSGLEITPPKTKTGYDMLHKPGTVICSDDSVVEVGRVFGDMKHVGTDKRIPPQDVADAYADTGNLLAFARFYDTEFGIEVAGIMAPGTTEVDAARFRGCDISPDWRPMPSLPMGDNLECVAMLAVNMSGFNLGLAASGEPMRQQVDVSFKDGQIAAMTGANPSRFTALEEVKNRLDDVEAFVRRQRLAAANEKFGASEAVDA